MLTNFNALALGLGPSIKVKERSFNNNEDISIIYCISRQIPLPFRIYSHETFIPPPIYDIYLFNQFQVRIGAGQVRKTRKDEIEMKLKLFQKLCYQQSDQTFFAFISERCKWCTGGHKKIN